MSHPTPTKLENITHSCASLLRRCEKYFSKIKNNDYAPSVTIIDKFTNLIQTEMEAIEKDKKDVNYQSDVDKKTLLEIEAELKGTLEKLNTMRNALAPEDQVNLSQRLAELYPHILENL